VLVDPGDAWLLGIDTMPGTYSCLLIRGRDDTVLIDTGWGPGARDDGLGRVLDNLETVAVTPTDVTHVLTTHVHGDHIGYHAPDGTPTFPDARYLVSRTDLDWLRARDDERAAVQRALLQPVIDAGQLDYLEETPLPLSIEAIPTPGHTPGHHAFRVDGVLNIGDVILLEPGLAYPDVRLGFDADTARAARTRREMYARAAETGDTVVAFHLPQPVGQIVADGAAWSWVPKG
jgi:glyoxylase-like metal-dependent hydrolase (beta-lactamase superfamily II)